MGSATASAAIRGRSEGVIVALVNKQIPVFDEKTFRQAVHIAFLAAARILHSDRFLHIVKRSGQGSIKSAATGWFKPQLRRFSFRYLAHGLGFEQPGQRLSRRVGPALEPNAVRSVPLH